MIQLLVFTIIFTVIIILGTLFVLPRVYGFARVYYKDYPIIGNIWRRKTINEGMHNDISNSNTCDISGCELQTNNCEITQEKGINSIVDSIKCAYKCVVTDGGCQTDSDCSKCGINADGMDYLTLFDEIIGTDPTKNNTPVGACGQGTETTIVVNCGAGVNSPNTEYSPENDQLAEDASSFNTVDNTVGDTSGNAVDYGDPSNVKDYTSLNNSQYIGADPAATPMQFPIRNSVTGMFNETGPCGHNKDQYVRDADKR
jgi:hypothetical protein